ncbi:MAG: tetratricopeptide repeat protein [Bacteroidales bacterium]|nr:tetratricopeptide repeat protein [Bacteroidales bacterium]
MAKDTLKDQQAKQQVRIDETVSKTEQFYQENKKLIWGILIAVAVIFLGTIAYRSFIYEPKVAEALEQMYPAENSFANGAWDVALNGDGNALGFADIIKEYGAKAGKAVYFYAGLCELELGNNEEALAYLKKYKGKDPILAARALACQGDANVNLGNYAEAVGCFEKAAKTADNMFAANYLLKAAAVYEETGDTASALKCYQTIKDKYPQSVEGYDIDKYISRIEFAK